eukprot:3895675-Prymnesium_polylepis.1
MCVCLCCPCGAAARACCGAIVVGRAGQRVCGGAARARVCAACRVPSRQCVYGPPAVAQSGRERER